MPPRLLLLSNGHGEDAIAAALVEPLRARGFELEAMPIVGEGLAYARSGVATIGPTKAMPSGGFIYGRPGALWRDLASGLAGLTLAQLAALQATRGRYRGVVAVGDVVPLAFAWLTRAPYVLVGCAKSDLYLGGKPGSYLWHERWLLARPYCGGVFPRDPVTAANLLAMGLPALDLGNPMMDGLEASALPLPPAPGGPTFLVVPGSRPEAPRNFALLAAAAVEVHVAAPDAPPRWLAPVASQLPLACYEAPGWTREGDRLTHPAGAVIHLLPGRFADCARAADLAFAMAGTATEQLAGLGVPVFGLAGPGPQFTAGFAEAQTRLLGPSFRLLPPDSRRVAREAWALIADPAARAAIAANGRQRMGPPGAAKRIAARIGSLWG